MGLRLFVTVAVTVLCAYITAGAADAPLADDPQAIAAKLLQIPAFKAKLEANKPVPTGDTLFDRYAAEIWQRNAPGAYFASGEVNEDAACLPDAVLAGWESDFGSDPRYWQLRYFSARARELNAADNKNEPATPRSVDSPALDFLRQALDKHHYDAATLKALFDETLTAQLVTNKDGFMTGEFKPGGAQVVLPIADRMVAEFPQESDSWYCRAQVKLALADDAGAMADVRQGNAAPQNRLITYFPWSVVMEGIYAGQAPGSQYICGMVLAAHINYTVPERFTYKKLLRHFEEGAAQSNDLPGWQPLHDMALRLASRKGEGPLFPVLWAGYSHSLAGLMLTEHPETLTVEQRKTLWHYSNRFLSTVKHDMNRIMDEEPQLEDMFKLMLGDMLDKSGKISDVSEAKLLMLKMLSSQQFNQTWFAREWMWATYLYLYEATAFENGKLRDRMIEDLGKFATWDWAKLDFIPTAEELQQQQAMEAVLKRIEAGEVNMDQAVKEMQDTDKGKDKQPAAKP